MPENSHPTNPNFQPVHIAPTDYNRADGFSPGSPISVKIPGLENQAAFDENDLVPITDMHAYADADQRVVVINADTGDRQPIWAEMDANPADDADRNLIDPAGRQLRRGRPLHRRPARADLAAATRSRRPRRSRPTATA